MVSHRIQKHIVTTLVHADTAHFSDLRPKGVDSNTLTYHISQLIGHKLIIKETNGTYRLTPAGKIVGTTISLSGKERLAEAHSILLLAIQNSAGQWLLRRRLVQPAYGKVGFLHGEPDAKADILTVASRRALQKTGLDCAFTVRGSGYIRLLHAGELESFVHFTLLFARSTGGELTERDETGENFWADEDNANNDLLPSMLDLFKNLRSNDLFFVDLTYDDVSQ
jgi:hypothetical protein